MCALWGNTGGRSPAAQSLLGHSPARLRLLSAADWTLRCQRLRPIANKSNTSKHPSAPVAAAREVNGREDRERSNSLCPLALGPAPRVHRIRLISAWRSVQAHLRYANKWQRCPVLHAFNDDQATAAHSFTKGPEGRTEPTAPSIKQHNLPALLRLGAQAESPFDSLPAREHDRQRGIARGGLSPHVDTLAATTESTPHAPSKPIPQLGSHLVFPLRRSPCGHLAQEAALMGEDLPSAPRRANPSSLRAFRAPSWAWAEIGPQKAPGSSPKYGTNSSAKTLCAAPAPVSNW